MRTREEIIARATEILRVCRHKYKEERLKRSFKNCVCNKRCVNRNVDFRYCSLKTTIQPSTAGVEMGQVFVCDTEDWASRCKEYRNKFTPETLEKEFMEIVSDPSTCGYVFPHLASLLWVLNKEVSTSPQRADMKNDVVSDVIVDEYAIDDTTPLFNVLRQREENHGQSR